MTDTEHDFLSLIGAPSPEASDGRATLTMGAAIRSVVEDKSPATSQLEVT